MKTRLLFLFGALMSLMFCLSACSSDNDGDERNQDNLYHRMQLAGYWTAQEFTNAPGNIVQIHFTSSLHAYLYYVTPDDSIKPSFASFKEDGPDKIRISPYKNQEIELQCDTINKEIHFTCNNKRYTLTKQAHAPLGIICGKWVSAYYQSHGLKADDKDFNTVEFGVEKKYTPQEHLTMKFEGRSHVGDPSATTAEYKAETMTWSYGDKHAILLYTEQGEKRIAYQFTYRPDLKTIVLKLNWVPRIPDNYITYTKNGR